MKSKLAGVGRESRKACHRSAFERGFVFTRFGRHGNYIGIRGSSDESKKQGVLFYRTTFRSLLNFILLFEYFWRVRSGIIDNIRRNLVGEKVSITTNRDFSRIGEISRASKRECEWNEKMEKERKKEGLTRERDRSQNYLVAHCTCIAILPGATTSGKLDQSFSTSAHHDIGLPYVHLRLLHPPTFSRPVVHLNPSLSHGGSPSVPSWSVGVALDQVKESIRPAYIRILHRSF